MKNYELFPLKELIIEINIVIEIIRDMKLSLKGQNPYDNGMDFDYINGYFEILRNIDECKNVLFHLIKLMELKKMGLKVIDAYAFVDSSDHIGGIFRESSEAEKYCNSENGEIVIEGFTVEVNGYIFDGFFDSFESALEHKNYIEKSY